MITKKQKPSSFRSEVNYDCINITNGKTVINFGIEDSSISCGVKELVGLNSFAATFYDKYRNKSEEIKELLESLFKEHRKYVNSNLDDMEGHTFLIMSNCLTSTADIWLGKILDSICRKTATRRNPNSENQIKIWIY